MDAYGDLWFVKTIYHDYNNRVHIKHFVSEVYLTRWKILVPRNEEGEYNLPEDMIRPTLRCNINNQIKCMSKYFCS